MTQHQLRLTEQEIPSLPPPGIYEAEAGGFVTLRSSWFGAVCVRAFLRMSYSYVGLPKRDVGLFRS